MNITVNIDTDIYRDISIPTSVIAIFIDSDIGTDDYLSPSACALSALIELIGPCVILYYIIVLLGDLNWNMLNHIHPWFSVRTLETTAALIEN